LQDLRSKTGDANTAVPGHPGSQLPYLNGTIQIETPAAIESLSLGLAYLRNEDPTTAEFRLEDEIWTQLLALSGLLRAMLNYGDTKRHELPSIFKEAVVAPNLLTVVHKGTFLRLADE